MIEDISLPKHEYNLLHIFIQDEENFLEVINFLSEAKDANISVIEANNASKYLYSLPLFSSFWSDETKGFHRLIIVTIEKTLLNDLLGKLNKLIKNLTNKQGILVFSQDIEFLNGSLDI